MTEAARTLADELDFHAKMVCIPDGTAAIMRSAATALRSPLPGTREEVAQADREALEKIERRDRYWVSSFDAEGKVVLQIDEINMRSLVLGPAGEIARAARADLALPPAPMPEREGMQEMRATELAIRELFELPADGDIFDRLVEWDEYRVVGEVRLQNAVHNVLAEPLYEGGKKDNGVAVKFLMRLTMLAHEAGLGGYDKSNPCVIEAINMLGDPGQPNTAEHIGAPRYQPECRAALASHDDKAAFSRAESGGAA